MQTHKSYYFINYKFINQLLLSLICLISLGCSGQNDAKEIPPVETIRQTAAPVININSASVADLEKLPHIGATTAREIIEHRERFGKFRKPEHLLLIRGISDKKFREIKNLVTAE